MANEKFLTDYIEVDLSGLLTVTDPKIDAAHVHLNSDCRVYKDFGANYFDALSVSWEAQVSSSSEQDGTGMMAGFANTLSNWYSFATTDLAHLIAKGVLSTNDYIVMQRGRNQKTDTYSSLNDNTTYYMFTARVAGNNTVTTEIYSDAAMATHLDTLSVDGFGVVKWQYAYGFNNHGYPAAGGAFYGFSQNMNLSAVPPTPPATAPTGHKFMSLLGVS